MSTENRSVTFASIVSAARSIVEPLEPRRLLTVGALDPGFGGTGLLQIVGTTDHFNAKIEHAVLQSDGKIVVSGEIVNDISEGNSEHITEKHRVIRYNPDGTRDILFNGTGYRIFDELDAGEENLALAADGKIVYAYGNHLVRLTSKGALDSSFGVNGMVTNDAGTFLAIGIGGKIITGTGGLIEQFNSNGTLDNTFGTKGKVRLTALGIQDFYARQMIRLADGKILLLGAKGDSTHSYGDFEFVRLNSNGSLDKTFGGKGFVISNLGHQEDLTTGVVASGKLLIAGTYFDSGDSSGAIVARYNAADGTLDKTFNTSGFREFKGETNLGASSLAVQSDGKILALDSSGSDSFGQICFLIRRFNSNGTDDTSFGFKGASYVAVPTDDADIFAEGNAMIVAPNDQLYIGGTLDELAGDTEQTTGVLMRLKTTDQKATFAHLSSTGTLSVVGTNFGDAISVFRDGSKMVALLDSQFLTFNLSSVKRVFIDAGAGSDRIHDDASLRSTILGGGDLDRIYGSSGADSIDGGDGDDIIFGDRGNDTIKGGAGNDELDGGDGNDLLDGGDGNDQLHGGDGTDTLRGGAGNNYFFAYDDPAAGIIDYSQSPVAIQMVRQPQPDSGSPPTIDQLIKHGSDTDQTLGTFKSLVGTAFADTLLGFLTYDSHQEFLELHGGAGNDTITGTNLADSLFGDAGNDSILGGDGNDSLDGGDGADTLHGQSGKDSLRGGAGADKLFGESGNDTFFATGGSKDILDGGDGTDSAHADVSDSLRSIEKILS